MAIIPKRAYVSVCQIMIKRKGRHFDTTEVIEAESQAVLNIPAEHDFRKAFKNGGSDWNCAHARKMTTLREMVTNRPKSYFLIGWQHPVPEIMNSCLYSSFLFFLILKLILINNLQGLVSPSSEQKSDSEVTHTTAI
jgi:hypothetical protein